MKIVLVTGTYLPYISGISSSTHSIARALADAGHDVTVIAPKSKQFDSSVDREPGIHVLRVWAVPDPWYIGRMITPFPILITEVDQAIGIDTDIVHVQEPNAIGLSAYVRARHVGVPVVGALHFTPEQVMHVVPWLPKDPGIKLVEWFIKWRYNKYDSIMVPTQTFVDFLRRIGVTAPSEVISNGVNTTRFAPTTSQKMARKKLNIPQDQICFLILSRLDKDKFVDDAIRALPRAHTRIRLIIAGVGPQQDSLHALAQSLGVTDRIIWYGKVSEQEMVDLYHAADGFIMMGIYEVQSIVTLQAVASGLPVLAVRAGALPELCHDKENGFLIPPHDSAVLADCMNNLAADTKLRHRMGKESRTISQRHDKKKAMARVAAWYGEVIAAYKNHTQ